VPELAGTEYGRTSLRHLLQMSSGVRFSEEYTGTDDVARLVANTYLLQGAGGLSAVTPFNERAATAGTKFSYASVETQVLGLAVHKQSVDLAAIRRMDALWSSLVRQLGG
jgi:CubicO group peptidase (beta-lactamase class C family)